MIAQFADEQVDDFVQFRKLGRLILRNGLFPLERPRHFDAEHGMVAADRTCEREFRWACVDEVDRHIHAALPQLDDAGLPAIASPLHFHDRRQFLDSRIFKNLRNANPKAK